MNKIIVGTRGSKLAVRQTEYIIGELKKNLPQWEFYIKTIVTSGDKNLSVTLPKSGDKGIFIKEIEHALLEGKIDIAVHSMKDIPTDVHPGLEISAIAKREDPRDVVVSSDNIKLEHMTPKAKLGTSSLRRRAQLLHYRPDIHVVPLRGNLNTRLEKLYQGDFSGVVLAYAGLKRLGYCGLHQQPLRPNVCLPAAGQGALGIQSKREEASRISPIVKAIDHPSSHIAVTAERAFLHELGGGCQVPVGTLGEVSGDKLHLSGIVASVDGRYVVQEEVEGPIFHAREIGADLAKKLLRRGADGLLEQARQEFDADE